MVYYTADATTACISIPGTYHSPPDRSSPPPPISGLSEPVQHVPDTAAEAPVKQRVRANLLRLLAKLERASAEEAQQMLTGTEELLQRHTTLRQRGTAGMEPGADLTLIGPDLTRPGLTRPDLT